MASALHEKNISMKVNCLNVWDALLFVYCTCSGRADEAVPPYSGVDFCAQITQVQVIEKRQ
jgi:hypothetical protein